MRPWIPSLLALALAVPLAAAQAGMPALLASAISATVAAEAPYAYEVHVTNERGSMHYAFDPAARGAARIRMIAPAESQLDARQRRFLERARADADGDIWCASRKLRDISDVQLVREDAATAVYSFTPSLEQIGEENARFRQHVRGELTISKTNNDVLAMRIASLRPFHASVARVDSFALTIRCETAENGRRYGAEATSSFRGSIFGNEINSRSTQRVTALRRR